MMFFLFFFIALLSSPVQTNGFQVTSQRISLARTTNNFALCINNFCRLRTIAPLLDSSQNDSADSTSAAPELDAEVEAEEPTLSYSEQMSTASPANTVRRRNTDPLLASLTRNDDAGRNIPTVEAPIFGEIPADNFLLLAACAAFGAIGFLFSLFVAFNSKDAIVQELSGIELPKMEYTPALVEEGVCRGLCSSQEEDLIGLRKFMESISK